MDATPPTILPGSFNELSRCLPQGLKMCMIFGCNPQISRTLSKGKDFHTEWENIKYSYWPLRKSGHSRIKGYCNVAKAEKNAKWMDVAVLHRNEFKEDPLCFVNVLFHSKRKQTTAIQIDMYERYTTVSFFI